MLKYLSILISSLLFMACSEASREVAYYTIAPAEMANTVTITRDSFGVPHIAGPTDESVLFGLAYARAEDHFSIIEEIVIAATGRQAELGGEAFLPLDYQIHAFQFRELSQQEYAGLPNKLKLLCDAYAAGLNYYLETHPEVQPKLLTHFEPWHFLAVERLIWTSMGFSQSGLRDDEVAAYLQDKGKEPQVGSNMWAISPQKSKNGKTYLVINPHIPADQPYEVHLKSDEGWNFYGVMAYGMGITPVLGHNESIAWSMTVNYPDVGDAFLIDFDHPTDSLLYKFDNGYQRAETWVDSIKVKTANGVISKAYTFRKTLHGPVLAQRGSQSLSCRIAGMERGGSIAQFYQMSKSADLASFQEALSATAIAYHNFMYADKAGNIHYTYSGAIPVRDTTLDWKAPVNGSDPRSEWKGYHSLNELPQLLNPASGYLQNCNSSPFQTTTGDNPNPADFPAYMTHHQQETKRAERSRILLDTLQNINLQTLERAIMDTYVQRAGETLPALFAEYDSLLLQDKSRTQILREPIEALRQWNRHAWVASKEASLYFIYDELLHAGAAAESWPNVSSLEKAVALLTKEKGRWDVPWGDIMRHQRSENNWQYGVNDSLQHYPIGGGPGNTGIMFCLWVPPLQDQLTRRSSGGHSYVAVVELGEQVKARSIIPYGNSRDPQSAHYSDQAALYAQGKMKPVLYTDQEIEQHKLERYQPGKRKK